MSRSPRRTLPLLLLLALALATAACDSDDFSTPIAPTDPITETFSGTVTPNGAVTHPFAVQRSGTVTTTLVSLSPDDTVVVGLSLGTWNGAFCQVILANDQATRGAVVTGQVTQIGTLCVRVYDAGGTLAEATSYELTVEHP